MFKTVAVIGNGLIGGSISLGLRASPSPPSVIGFDTDSDVLQEGLRRGAFTSVAGSAATAVATADLIVVATPVDATAALCGEIADAAPPGAVVTDVGSAKEGVVRRCEDILGSRFVGGHPMAGSERHGISAAHAELFQDAWWILTPTPATSSRTYRIATNLATALGARPVALDPSDHDRLLARLSHLPQLAASALVTALLAAEDKESLLGLAAGGFRDVTRIASSEPGLWVTILRANREAALDALQDFGSTLGDVAAMLAEERWEDLAEFLGRARDARITLFAKPLATGVPVSLTMPVLDRPGVLAEVTTAAGAIGANIEDLQIVHSTEGGRGRLEVVVAGEGAAAELASALGKLGYRVEQGRPE